MVPPFMPRYSVGTACAGEEASNAARGRHDKPENAIRFTFFIEATFLFPNE